MSRQLPNPGGQLDPKNIYGRDPLIARYWQILDGQCIYVNDLRRIGKTQIMVKMAAEPPAGWLCIHQDLEGCHNAGEFAAEVFRSSLSLLGAKKRGLRRMEMLLGKLAGTEIAGVLTLPEGQVAPWKEVLSRTFADLEEAMGALGCRLAFLWDEVPYLLDNIAKRDGKQTAMEVLDVLRALSQKHDHVRLFLTGSIGLHHVLEQLHGEGYSGSPLNRMSHQQPGPLEEKDAIALAGDLLLGSGFAMADPAGCAIMMAEVTGNVAFYVHKLVSRLPKTPALDPALIDGTLVTELTADDDDWDFGHYRRRLTQYYAAKEKPALAVLDAVAMDQPMDFQQIRRALAAKQAYDDEDLRSLLALLCRDHYLRRDAEGRYRFYLEIIRRWWELSRSL